MRKDDGTQVFLERMFGVPNAIERSEARGQQEMLAQAITQLPRRWNGAPIPEPPEGAVDWTIPDGWDDATPLYQALGIAVSEPADGDTLFYDVVLPDGWELKGGGSAYWSGVFDAEGRKRLAVFYKAAFYDRSAHVSAERRYVSAPPSGYPEKPDDPTLFAVVDQKTGVVVFRPKPKPDPDKAYDYDHGTGDACRVWLHENKPDGHTNPLAYWDDE